jgi:hypothetical protein
MAVQLPPPPNEPIGPSKNWRDWIFSIWQYTTTQAANAFNGLNFSGSNITSIVTRNHNDLQNIQGGASLQAYHLTQAEQTVMASIEPVGASGTILSSNGTTTTWIPNTGGGSTTNYFLNGGDGEDGQDGFSIVGPQGPQGIQGIPGSGGSGSSATIPGMDGENGEDAFPIPGPQGQQGIQGVTGPAGVTLTVHAFDALDGEDGLQGPPGPQGPQGVAGTNGTIGVNGVPGFDGEDGLDGMPIPGPVGPAGAIGPTGPSGSTVIVQGFDGMDGEEAIMIPGPKGDTGAAGGGGGSVTIKTASVNVPYGSTNYLATVVDASVLSGSNLLLSYGVYTDTDENDPEDDVLNSFHVKSVSAGSFNIEIDAIAPQTLGGVLKFNYLIG